LREDLRSALEIAGVHRRIISSKGVQANEHIPENAKVLCALISVEGMLLLLDTGILRLELREAGTVAELIPFTALSKVSVKKALGTYSVDIQMHKPFSGVLSGVTLKRESASRFEEMYLSINPLAAKKTKLREDFARARGHGPDDVPDDLDIEMESYIPEDSEVLFLIGGLGQFILLDTGVLRLKLKLFGGPIGGSEFVPLSQIKGVSVKDRNPGYAVEVRREEGSVVIAGSSFKTNDFFGLTDSKEEALKFQGLLLGLLDSSTSKTKSPDNALGKIGQLKELLDAGAINQDEFDEKKKKLLDSI
jgi:hypothetical protein